MKKHLKKLTLNRETLRNLAKIETAAVVGANTNPTSCRCRIETGCECETQAGCTALCTSGCPT